MIASIVATPLPLLFAVLGMASSSASKALFGWYGIPRAGVQVHVLRGKVAPKRNSRVDARTTSPLPIGSTAMFETHVEADEMMSWPMMLKLCKSATH